MAAEAVSSPSFQAAFDALDPDGKQIEVDFAIYALEDNPGWGDWRFLAPASSQFHGFMLDLSVDGYAIVYKLVDGMAAIELWYLHELPEWRTPKLPKKPGPVPFM